jgi:hypothetical protein
MSVPAEYFSLSHKLPPGRPCWLRLHGAHFSYLSGLECTFAKDDRSQQRAPTTFRTADLLDGRKILSPEFLSREQTEGFGEAKLTLGRRFPADRVERH